MKKKRNFVTRFGYEFNKKNKEKVHLLNFTFKVTPSLQVFDKHNRGFISASDLRAVLHCLGEELSEEESKCREIFSFFE